MNIRVSGAIVLYNNNRQMLEDAIKSFLSNDWIECLYLVDNSPSDSLSDLKLLDSRIIYIFNPSNPGFGAAHNIALKKSIENSVKYHLVLNPDVYFDNSVMETLTEFMEENVDIGNVMPLVKYPDKSIQYVCKLLPTPYDWIGRRFNPIKSMVEKRNLLFELKFTGYNNIMDVPYLSGCFMFLRCDVIKKVGMFDENIFMYGEETDLCRRIIDKGFRTVFYPDVSIYHHFAKGSHKSWRLTKIGIKSAIYYFNKWGWFFDKRRKEINSNTLDKLKR
ncbi:glycosyltransferase family 2 protein [Myroides odoratimimus]|uniref:glycosyltransferase family 2 protein n=1 Tax=Myroides odoratimimus TaxID=76832 RepID=UPI0010399A22|nr:glycosyltransferase family 2 protein [Myroides odoratimimus]QBK77614.1 glycosyltransferase family 2 protein [Myroides odoratimimus]WHT73061.1 glycosyltransferase family 2 protein [Myroides odoratimimus]WHU37644.1 glycosyltransferase family 2 protein [Myroides odoratimimus]